MERNGTRRIRLGMVGGGQGAFIGAVHRIAARLDDRFELVAGAFSADPARAQASGAALGIDPSRVYDSYDAIAAREGRRKAGIEAVAIVTPNHLHAPVARAFLKRGIHVICDKPLTATLPEAKLLAKTVAAAGARFFLTHNYSATPMIRQARAMVAAGEIGAVRLVQVQYAQDWLATPLEATGQKQAAWRTDPAQTGAGGAIGDIGTHAYHLARFVTGLRLEALAAELSTFVPGRRVDDNAQVMLRFDGGARGAIWASQVAAGEENALVLRVYGETGGLTWRQEDPNVLWHGPLGHPLRRITRGGPVAGPDAAAVSRVPPGHPEGYLEAFATLYAEIADALADPDAPALVPGIDDGVEGVAFVDACIRSSRRDAAWVTLAL